VIVEIGKFALAAVVTFSYPLLHYPARAHIDHILVALIPEHKIPRAAFRYIGITLTVMAISYIISIVLPDISIVFSFVGATAGNLIVFIVPAIMYIKLVPGIWYSVPKLCALTLVMAGMVSGLISVSVIIYDEIV